MAKSYTLEDLKLANELCFPADMEKFLKEKFPDYWVSLACDFKNKYKSDLFAWMFAYSRADQKNGMGEVFEYILDNLLQKEQKMSEINAVEELSKAIVLAEDTDDPKILARAAMRKGNTVWFTIENRVYKAVVTPETSVSFENYCLGKFDPKG